MEKQMTQVSDVMRRGVRTLTPRDTLVQAARAMDELDVGAIPVCEGERLLGMVTDRDMVVRGIAKGGEVGRVPIEDVMSGDPRWCYEDQDLDEVREQLRRARVRQIPVFDHAQHLVGILALGDVAGQAGAARAGAVLAQASEPARAGPSGDGARAASSQGPGSGGLDPGTGGPPGPMANAGMTSGGGVVSGGDGGEPSLQGAFGDDRGAGPEDAYRLP
jgi:CBS domain-containing protein